MQAVPLVLAAAIGHVLNEGVDLGGAVPLVLGGTPGTFLGARMAAWVSQSVIRRGIVIVLFLTGLKMLGVPPEWVGIIGAGHAAARPVGVGLRPAGARPAELRQRLHGLAPPGPTARAGRARGARRPGRFVASAPCVSCSSDTARRTATPPARSTRPCRGSTSPSSAGARPTPLPGRSRTAASRRSSCLTLTRTRQTAAPLASLLGIEPSELDGLREISAGDFEMAADHDAIAGYIGTVADWIECRYDTRMPGGESGVEFLGRYDAAVAEIDRAVARAGHQNALAVSHGAAIRTWLSARVRDVEAHARATDPLHNTACIELVGDPRSGWTVEAWHSEPVGGAFLDDATAPDPTGQATDEAAGHAPDQAQN